MECWVGTTAVSPLLTLPGWLLVSLKLRYWFWFRTLSAWKVHLCSVKITLMSETFVV